MVWNCWSIKSNVGSNEKYYRNRRCGVQSAGFVPLGACMSSCRQGELLGKKSLEQMLGMCVSQDRFLQHCIW